jgi:hypothetical protein
MKIYINNLNIDNLESILGKINDYLLHSETYIKIYSIEGIFKINDSSIKKLISVDKEIKIIKNFYEDFTLILDPSYFREEISTTLPVEHTSTKMKRCIFKIDKKSNVEVVIEGSSMNVSLNKWGFKPNDMYFQTNENIDINDALIKKEIIVFLSLLN